MSVSRRRFLASASGMGMSLAMGSSFWARAFAQSAPGASPYGELLAPDANGLQLPAGFTSRIVARAGTPVAGTAYVWHPFPDGGACLPTEDGGWIYVSNSENPPPADLPVGPVGDAVGGASAVRFSPDGTVVDAYQILSGSQSNCAGGLTPWGTWLSCEEIPAGRVWECDPLGEQPAVVRPSLGTFKHEMAAVDPERHHVYLSEDRSTGLLYRYTPPAGAWGSGAALEGGTLEAMAVGDGGAVTWVPVGPGATTFNGGEGLIYDDGAVYLTTKGDDRVWKYDVEAGTMTVLYERGTGPLGGVDNIVASSVHDLYVAEDGDNMEVCVITPDLVVAPVVRMTGQQHGFRAPIASEVTGLAFSPDGDRLYMNSQRGFGTGVLYEVTGPWRGGSLAETARQQPAPTTTVVATPPPPGGTIARTGGEAALGWAGAAGLAAALAARATRSRP